MDARELLGKMVHDVEYTVDNERLAERWISQGIPLEDNGYQWKGDLKGNAAVDFIISHRDDWHFHNNPFDKDLNAVYFYTDHTNVTVYVNDPPAFPEPFGPWHWVAWDSNDGLDEAEWYADRDNASAFLRVLLENGHTMYDDVLDNDDAPIEERIENYLSTQDTYCNGQLYCIDNYIGNAGKPPLGSPVYKVQNSWSNNRYAVARDFKGCHIYQGIEASFGDLVTAMILG